MCLHYKISPINDLDRLLALLVLAVCLAVLLLLAFLLLLCQPPDFLQYVKVVLQIGYVQTQATVNALLAQLQQLGGNLYPVYMVKQKFLHFAQNVNPVSNLSFL